MRVGSVFDRAQPRLSSGWIDDRVEVSLQARSVVGVGDHLVVVRAMYREEGKGGRVRTVRRCLSLPFQLPLLRRCQS